jgi:hypothetical protein
MHVADHYPMLNCVISLFAIGYPLRRLRALGFAYLANHFRGSFINKWWRNTLWKIVSFDEKEKKIMVFA